MGSTCRDRTSEFRSLSQTLRKIGGGGGWQAADPLGAGVAPPTTSQPGGSTRSEFNKKASRIGLGIHEASQKIARLTKLTKKSSMFDDPTIEIQQLTALIKDDITAMNMALQDLQTLQNLEMSDGRYSEDKAVHYTTVCDDLKGRLLGTTKQLQDVLTTRTQNVKTHESRKQMFSANVSRENQFRQQTNHLTEPPPWSTSSNEPGNSPPTALPSNGSQVGSQLRRRLAVENTPSHQMEVSMLQQVAPQQDTYAQSRATALHSVESTIAELGGIFTHLASMVAQQGEVAIRIDDNMEESLANVEGARSVLLRHLNQISSNSTYIVLNGLLQLLTYSKEKNAILFTYPPAVSFSSTGLVVSSILSRFSDLYTLTISSADPKSVSANKPAEFTKSVTQWFTMEGRLVEGLFRKDVEALVDEYNKEPKKTK